MKKLKSSYTVLILSDVLFCTVHIINLIASGGSKDLGLIPLVLGDLLFCLIYLSIHGIVTYSVYRSVFYPHIITGAVLLITTIGMFLSPLGNDPWLIGSSLFLCVCFVISLIFSLLTMCAFKIYNKMKHSTKNAKTDSDY